MQDARCRTCHGEAQGRNRISHPPGYRMPDTRCQKPDPPPTRSEVGAIGGRAVSDDFGLRSKSLHVATSPKYRQRGLPRGARLGDRRFEVSESVRTPGPVPGVSNRTAEDARPNREVAGAARRPDFPIRRCPRERRRAHLSFSPSHLLPFSPFRVSSRRGPCRRAVWEVRRSRQRSVHTAGYCATAP